MPTYGYVRVPHNERINFDKAALAVELGVDKLFVDWITSVKVEIIPNTDKIKVTVLNFPQNITDELYEEYTIGRNSCVIDNKTLRQIYPECMNQNKTRLNQFINMVKSMKGNLEKVK